MNMLLSDKAHYESHLEEYIVSKLKAQGWLVGESKNYDTDTALYTEDLIGWIKDTQPEKWDISIIQTVKTLKKPSSVA